MKKLFFPAILMFVFAGLACSGCKDDDPVTGTGTTNLVFKATYNNEPFVGYKNFDFLDGNQVFFNLFQFFISDVELLRADGTAQKLVDVDFVNLTFTDNAAALAGKTITATNIPEGKYTGLRLGIGVKPSLNGTNPNTLPDSNPLTVNGRGEFWSGWKSYIFMKIEGKYDANGDGAAFEQPLLYHCGSDAVYRTLTFTQPIEVAKNGTASVTISTDIAKILRENGQPFNLVAEPATSDDPTDVTVATKLMNNLQDAIKMQ